MLSGRADLHIHSTASDGAMTPAEVVQEAARVGLAAICLSDHDTVDGLREATIAAKSAGIECVPGVEINTDFGDTELHIMGYFIDPDCPELAKALSRLRDARVERTDKIVQKLRGLGVKVTMDRVLEIAGHGSIGRPHIAQAICESGATSGMAAAFGKYLARGAAAYVPRSKMTPEEAVKIIIAAGGAAGLAHPGKIGNDGIILDLMNAGLRALEVYHTDHKRSVSRRYKKLANKYGLIPTGGSDCHGERPVSIGIVTVDIEIVEQLRQAARGR
ncbi:MAG: PHP domain-containing protein [Armatimonadota bacterium]|nr:PHP domain-containing protein [Armatimonadota bacterium]